MPVEPAAGGNGVADLDAAVQDVLEGLSLEEKVGLLSGCGMWESGGVPRLGIQPLRMTDGPHGARGLSTHGDSGALLAPSSLALAATFNERTIEQVGVILGKEACRRGADILLGPCLNLQRFPNSGRHFECFSEDPYLAARAGAAYVRGVQKHAIACAKHFVCNDQETDRGTVNSVVDERTLREVYLQPFQAAVEAGVGAVMCGYNRLNGTYCTENGWLLDTVLRAEWGFRGLVMSDWFGNQSTLPALRAGLNVEMPGVEPRHFGGYLVDSVRAGRVPQDLLDERCVPVLRALLRPDRGAGGQAAASAAAAEATRQEEEQLLSSAAEEACVLIKNDGGALPLDLSRLKKVAVIGPNAGKTTIQGGGSSRVHPAAAPTILEALREALEPAGVQVVYAQGCEWEKLPSSMMSLEVNGLMSMGTCDASGQPLTSMLMPTSATINDMALVIGSWLASREWFRLVFMPALRFCGWRNTTPAEAVARAPVRQPLAPPQPAPNAAADAMVRAAETAAADADACILVLGTHGFWELEGVDQPHGRLLGRQNELVDRVARAAKGRVVVVLNVGSPKELPWFDQVKAVLLAHFGGQGMSGAVARLLVGAASPAGRLPTTWPHRFEEAPAVVATRQLGAAAPGEVPYAEGLRLGYRASGPPPRLPFGYGLSYTTFSHRDFVARQTADCGDGGPRASARVTVRNDGGRPGAEVVQLYVETEEGLRCLRGFCRTQVLEPGEQEGVAFELGPLDLGARFDVSKGHWKHADAGTRLVVSVGASSADRRQQETIVLR